MVFLIELLRHESGDCYKILLLDQGHLYLLKIEGVLEQILVGCRNLSQQDQIHIRL